MTTSWASGEQRFSWRRLRTAGARGGISARGEGEGGGEEAWIGGGGSGGGGANGYESIHRGPSQMLGGHEPTENRCPPKVPENSYLSVFQQEVGLFKAIPSFPWGKTSVCVCVCLECVLGVFGKWQEGL